MKSFKYSQTGQVQTWEYQGQTFRYKLVERGNRKRRSLYIHKDGVEIELSGHDIRMLSNIF